MNYIGSKLSLLEFIDSVVNKLNFKNDNIVFCDIFTGTAAVSKYFKNKGYNIVSNDLQYYSYITAKHFIENNKVLKI